MFAGPFVVAGLVAVGGLYVVSLVLGKPLTGALTLGVIAAGTVYDNIQKPPQTPVMKRVQDTAVNVGVALLITQLSGTLQPGLAYTGLRT